MVIGGELVIIGQILITHAVINNEVFLREEVLSCKISHVKGRNGAPVCEFNVRSGKKSLAMSMFAFETRLIGFI